MNRNSSDAIDDNERWAVARKILLRVFETVEVPRLIELLVHWNSRFTEVLMEGFSAEPLPFYLLVREKTHVMMLYEVVYRRLTRE